MKTFNTTGCCIPDMHYMVNIEDKLQKIKQLVDRGAYFVINRARQYGKTTTLGLLKTHMADNYLVISLDFQMMSNGDFRDEETFVNSFAEIFLDMVRSNPMVENGLSEELLEELENAEKAGNITGLRKLFGFLSRLCGSAKRPVVLMIDEVDSAANNQVFLDFLAQLRAYYLARSTKATFQSVILAGVYDIKNLKLKLRPEAEHKYNSPWNIAETFDVDMSFSANAIEGMLEEYERDHHTGMNPSEIADCIYGYTSGYPFLVSSICKVIEATVSSEERFQKNESAWSRSGVAEAVKMILKANNIPLFETMMKQLENYPMLRTLISEILYQGKQIPFSPDVEAVNMGVMFGFLQEKGGMVAVANRIFEMRLLNMFISEEALGSESYQAGLAAKNQFIKDGRLNMDLVLKKFVQHYTDISTKNDEKFLEKQGRKIFLLYLKPIINGTGNYYIEAETRDSERTDVVVDYLGQQFVVELKIWHGEKYNARGEKQLAEYLDKFHLNKGYMLTFSFNKKKQTGIQNVKYGNKTFVEAVV